MSVQNTFRTVFIPKLVVKNTALVAGELPLNFGTVFVFTGDAVSTVSSLKGHEYLIDGQEIAFINGNATQAVTFNVGSFSKTIPAGYRETFYFDSANVSFRSLPSKDSEFKVTETAISANTTAISQEITNRQADTARMLMLDGTRPMAANLDMATNAVINVKDAAANHEAVNKGQMDVAIAILQSQIAANATALKWREPVHIITKRIVGAIPANGDALADSNFGDANGLRLFEDDAAPEQFTVANMPVDKTVLFLKAGVEPKLMVVRDVLGTKKWYDHTEANVALKVDRAVGALDTFIVKNDLLDDIDLHEKTAIYHIENTTPKTAIKVGDFDWNTATGIKISASYFRGAGDETVTAGDSVEIAISKVDGNIAKEKTDRIADVNAKISQEIADRNTAISTAIAKERTDTANDITVSQNAQNAKIASTTAGEGASLVGINDFANRITATTVEGALAENRQLIDASIVDITSLESDMAQAQSDISTNSAGIAQNAADLATLETELASNSAGKGASMIGLEDAEGRFTSTNVEGALKEVHQKVESLVLAELERGLFEATVSGGNTINLATDLVDSLSNGTVQNLSDGTYMNLTVVRDGAIVIGGVGFTLAGGVLTFNGVGGGNFVENEVIEVKMLRLS